MKTAVVLTLLLAANLLAQSTFTFDDYARFRRDNAALTTDQIIHRHEPPKPYYNDRSDPLSVEQWAFLDSIQLKYGLTNDELLKLGKNHFVVSERLSFDCFGRALHDVYQKDLPVFVTTDAVLYALHFSYDRILFTIERTILEKKLRAILESCHNNFSQYAKNYAQPQFKSALQDVDLYVTIARSLLDGRLRTPNMVESQTVAAVWQAIEAEQMTVMPLFTTMPRKLDFSQFTVRGHYTDTFWDEDGERTLGNYFRAMMWLGRTDFLLTPPPDDPPYPAADIQRMAAGALLLNELLTFAGVHDELEQINAIITFMVGESDNLTPSELTDFLSDNGFSIADVFNEASLKNMQRMLTDDDAAGQKIMSDLFVVDPFAEQPDTLPVSFRLCGQRFIIDSYILANVVYDRVIFNNRKVWRPLPDPLDAMFVLGNDNALPLLRDQLESYTYAPQLAALRYLVDAFDQPFWQQSLYNVWLQSIRELAPSHTPADAPYFMKTAAWQQQKLNTQLASWTHLRHDNLLYAKQSYTGMTSCSYPHSYVEPYPEFYQRIASFADAATLSLLPLLGDAIDGSYELFLLKGYFEKLRTIMNQLAVISHKELRREAFSEGEIAWLQKMLFLQPGSGAPPFSGWYADLLYNLTMTMENQYEGHDYLIADVHTQPTDEFGAMIGHVLHVAVGKVNLGIFLAHSPSADLAPMAFVGPVLSYYETITENFERLTDEEWGELVVADNVPQRPDWVNSYMTDANGRAKPQGRELPGVLYVETTVNDPKLPLNCTLKNHPNPFNPTTRLTFTLVKESDVRLTVFDLLGKEVATLVDRRQAPGVYTVDFDASALSAGVYFARLVAGGETRTIKMMLVR